MALDFSKLQADVAAEQTVVDSVVALLEKLAQELRDALAGVPDPAAQAAIDDVAAKLEAHTAALAAAVAANTPVA